MKRSIAAVCFMVAVSGCLLSAGAVAAQEPSTKTLIPSVRTTAEATVTTRPDQAQMDLGVVTQAAAAQAAAAENAKKLERVLQAIRGAAEPEAEITTVSYSLTPNYVYPPGGGNPKLTGYTASNSLRVKTSDLARVGKIIDAAVQAGANNAENLQFLLKNDQAVVAEALGQAVRRARSKADAIASALGMRVTRVLLVEESGSVARPLLVEASAAADDSAAVATPIVPGTLDVQATVTLVVEIAP